MKLTIDSDVLAYAFIEPTKEVYKERFDEFKALHNKADYIYKGVIRDIDELKAKRKNKAVVCKNKSMKSVLICG